MSFLLTPQQIGRRKVAFEATGGTTQTYTSGGVNYKSHTFLTSSTAGNHFVVTNIAGICQALVVAGGGGSQDGGGGAGGMLEATNLSFATGEYVVNIGAGGTGGRRQPNINPGAGTASSGLSPIPSAAGGGHGCYSIPGGQVAGGNGGSGGGGYAVPNAGGEGTAGQGNDGGTGVSQSEAGAGGGGGGKGAVGGNAPNGNLGGDGGTGTSSVYRTGSGVFYAGGGGGPGDSPGNALGGDSNGGEGGNGGGGNSRSNAQAGAANTGGGSGGPCNFFGAPANGGSGIVVIRYDVDQ